MSGMGGMDMSEDGMFRPYSQWLATVYWYLIAAIVGMGLLLHLIHLAIARIRYVRIYSWLIQRSTILNKGKSADL